MFGHTPERVDVKVVQGQDRVNTLEEKKRRKRTDSINIEADSLNVE